MPTTKIQGHDFYYESTGEGDPILFLHGLGSSSIDWEFQIPAFARSHRVIAMDVRGHGRSAKPAGPYTVKQMAADAVALLEQLGAVPAHIVGLSMGGMIAFQMAVDAPQAVRSLTIVNSGPEMILRTPEQKAGIEARYTIVRTQGMRALAKIVAGPLFPNPDQAALRQRFEDQVAGNDPEAYLAALGAINGWSVTDRIGAIGCPVLIVASDQDYTPVEWKHFYAAQIPGARVVVLNDSRHAAPLDQPEQLNRAVAEFLGSAVLRRS
ncbi:MAG: alpha/beta hydrolase [Acidobacteriia bacterium]|nr:alpha/beta hydrolase [Terriglobia bacterium]